MKMILKKVKYAYQELPQPENTASASSQKVEEKRACVKLSNYKTATPQCV
jgi:hypothetical protein